jgi:RNA polymerase sigma-70 factor (ECF subfamily)
VQKVCVKVMTHLHQFSGTVPFLHWVSRIAVNTCLNQIRHEKHRPELRLADLSEAECLVVENLATSRSALDASDQVAATELVEKLLQGLEPKARLLMRLIHLEGRSLEDVSRLTGWSRGSVKVRAYRARQLLRKRYALLMKETP